MISNKEVHDAIRSAFLAVFGGQVLTGSELVFAAQATDSIMGIVNNDAPCVACAEREEHDNEETPTYVVKTVVYKDGVQVSNSKTMITT